MLGLSLAYQQPQIDRLRSFPDLSRLEELFGDREIASDHPLARRLAIRVEAMSYEWRHSAVERFCG